MRYVVRDGTAIDIGSTLSPLSQRKAAAVAGACLIACYCAAVHIEGTAMDKHAAAIIHPSAPARGVVFYLAAMHIESAAASYRHAAAIISHVILYCPVIHMESCLSIGTANSHAAAVGIGRVRIVAGNQASIHIELAPH